MESRADISFSTDWDKLLAPSTFPNGVWATRLKECIDAGRDLKYEIAPIADGKGRLSKKRLPVPAEYQLPCHWDPRKGDERYARAHQETVAELKDFTKMRSHLKFLSKLKYKVPFKDLSELLQWISGLERMAGDLQIYDATVGDVNGSGKVVYVSRGRSVPRAAAAARARARGKGF